MNSAYGWGGSLANITNVFGAFPNSGGTPSTASLASLCTNQQEMHAFVAGLTVPGAIHSRYKLDDPGRWAELQRGGVHRLDPGNHPHRIEHAGWGADRIGNRDHRRGRDHRLSERLPDDIAGGRTHLYADDQQHGFEREDGRGGV